MKTRKRRKPAVPGGWLEYWQLDNVMIGDRRVRLNCKSKVEVEHAMTSSRREKETLDTQTLAIPHDVRVAMVDANRGLAEIGVTIGQGADFFLSYCQRIPDIKLDQAIVEQLAARRAAYLQEG